MWYSQLSVTEKVFFYIAIIASAMLIIQIIMLLFSLGGAGDADFDGDFDGGVDGDVADGGLSFFTLKGLTAFFALGGWCGFAAATYIPNAWVPILISIVTGTAALLGVGFAMRGIAKLQCSGNLVKDKLVGMSATVYVSVPPSREGRGKITLTAQGKFMELDAMTDEKEKLSTDTQVKILSFDDDFVVVGKEKESDLK